MRVVLREDKICPSCHVRFDEAPAAREKTLAIARKAAVGRLKSVNVAIGLFFLCWIVLYFPIAIFLSLIFQIGLGVGTDGMLVQFQKLLVHALCALCSYLVTRRYWPINAETR